MLIDEFLPGYDVREKHRIEVHAPLERVYDAVRRLDLGHAKISMLLLRLRGITTGLPPPTSLTLDDFQKMDFVLLGERRNGDLLLGLAGRF